MAYTKKEWVDVSDPSNLPDIPDGQDALCRFDAANMNRIEDGIQETKDEIAELDASKAPNGYGLGTTLKDFGEIPFEDLFNKGTGFYQMDSAPDNPGDSPIATPTIQLSRHIDEGSESGVQLAMPDRYISNPKIFYRVKFNGEVGDWYQLLHTGNAPTLVSNAITRLPIKKGGTGATTVEEAKENLGINDLDWVTLGSVSYNSGDINQIIKGYDETYNSPFSKTITIPVDTEAIRDFGMFRYVIKAGSNFACSVQPYSSDDTAAAAQMRMHIKAGTDKSVLVYVNTDYIDVGLNEIKSFNFTTSEDLIFKTSNGIATSDAYSIDSTGGHFTSNTCLASPQTITISVQGRNRSGNSTQDCSVTSQVSFTIELQGKR